MKKVLVILAVTSLLLILASCATVRDRGELPQIIRLDREVVAEASRIASLPTGETATISIVDDTTFSVNEDGAIVFHVAHMYDTSHSLHTGLLIFAEQVETRSNGTLLAEIHGNAIIGSDTALVNMVNEGELDAAIITIWGVWHPFTALANFDSLPFVFTNYEEAWAAYEGTLGEWVAENVIEPHGAKSLGFWTNGMRHFTNNVRPIYTPANMNGLNMRSPQIATHLEVYEALGATSTSIPFDQLFTALAADTIDGQDNPIGTIHASRLFEVQQYLSLSNHMYSAAPFIVSTNFWNSLSQEQQWILQESSLYAAREQGELARTMEEHQLREIRAAGVEVNNIAIYEFIPVITPIWEDHISRFGNDFITIASRYIADPMALAHYYSRPAAFQR
ncbi:MAG: DctP family TRAP transporter solute-binding subunit [Defluviitaleaceae bacterium]|nr:DctP family TRAP transporter solute-binding subunit [Defluviitaleaceae bacterium]